jgi:2-polyprenyl-6-methoxyphenol hydroxylase-like FAD-dependent oxidoreductase
MKKIAIIGAGFGGLSAALTLSERGMRLRYLKDLITLAVWHPVLKSRNGSGLWKSFTTTGSPLTGICLRLFDELGICDESNSRTPKTVMFYTASFIRSIPFLLPLMYPGLRLGIQ